MPLPLQKAERPKPPRPDLHLVHAILKRIAPTLLLHHGVLSLRNQRLSSRPAPLYLRRCPPQGYRSVCRCWMRGRKADTPPIPRSHPPPKLRRAAHVISRPRRKVQTHVIGLRLKLLCERLLASLHPKPRHILRHRRRPTQCRRDAAYQQASQYRVPHRLADMPLRVVRELMSDHNSQLLLTLREIQHAPRNRNLTRHRSPSHHPSLHLSQRHPRRRRNHHPSLSPKALCRWT